MSDDRAARYAFETLMLTAMERIEDLARRIDELTEQRNRLQWQHERDRVEAEMKLINGPCLGRPDFLGWDGWTVSIGNGWRAHVRFVDQKPFLGYEPERHQYLVAIPITTDPDDEEQSL